ncbi:hypothetical protein GAY88_17785 [Phocaeicola vulgatus]|jgi:AMMECR1 domain-containing protein|uniref:Uncharacterized protein n=1 Tax=Phocaeicola vulgatus TaxID=821 RepID=A0A6I0ZZ52_PHOVU|nr:hypothetical protein [Phocaeicola vulgatus]KAB6449946.1 hypothetical protein GAZ08_05520 [Phocaeicola vulgatus]KAB6464544.1 hypothetical protein GAZ07_22325 [Phocaeicola vulgatus]KAB6465129.1 hypothetical protein GAZ05_05345 [Phocaeicola vulgatus]KAB6478307.1 hypothetical protein GAZ03_06435 [Phocaeicola vulgatus]KAB6489824.1 hypothetical protein GAZ01_06810 [Phocaeicola vulgatus]
MIDFFPTEHISSSKKRKFGICDRPAPTVGKAYIAEKQGQNWIAAVDNYPQIKVNFVPIDHCLELRKADGKMDNRCDGCLFYEDTIIFVELKQRGGRDNHWIKEGERQLRSTIGYFEQQEKAQNFSMKKAYIANSARPLFRTGQAVRMERFFLETNYILRIENRIKIE